MSHDQIAVLAVWAGALALFASGRWRADLVALLALVAAVLLGAVPADGAFAGLADPAVAAVAAVLVLGAAVRDSGLVDGLRPALAALPRWTGLEVGVTGAVAAALSAALSGPDAFAAAMPVSRATARRGRRSHAPLVTALGAAAALGGLASAVGTGPNLLAASLRRDIVGAPFRVFDFAPVGAAVAAAGVLFLTVAWRLVPRERGREPDAEEAALAGESFTSEVAVPAGSPLVGQTVGAFRARTDRAVSVAAIVREDYRRIAPRRESEIAAGDVLVLNCEPDALQSLLERARGLIVGAGVPGLDPDRAGVLEAVIAPNSELVGKSPMEAGLDARHRVALLAVGRRGEAIAARLRRTKLRAGDVLVLQGEIDAMSPTMAALGCLTLAERRLRLGRHRRIGLPALALAGALALAAMGLLPLAVALLCAVVALVALRALSMAEVYGSVAWPVVVLFAALLPISAALRRSGAADALAGQLAAPLAGVSAPWTVALTLAAALLVTPVFNGAAVMLALGPVAAGLAARLGVSADPYLMAVAVGASCDVFGPLAGRPGARGTAGERAPARAPSRLALALTALVAAVGAPAILLAWPLR